MCVNYHTSFIFYFEAFPSTKFIWLSLDNLKEEESFALFSKVSLLNVFRSRTVFTATRKYWIMIDYELMNVNMYNEHFTWFIIVDISSPAILCHPQLVPGSVWNIQ